MRDYCFKLIGLKNYEVENYKRFFKYYMRRGVKVTFLKRVIFIHLDDTKTYTCIANCLYNNRRKLVCSDRSLKWLKHWNHYSFGHLTD